ncbi:MAG: hypothetical protein MUQ25_11440, partial [Candidatus Aminicenantes bacterium]|nr:hypothetical protein [Candidatus Aminicenantes bacterium]
LVEPDEPGEGLPAAPPRVLHETSFLAFIHLVLTPLDGHYTKSFERGRGSLTSPSSYCYDFVLHTKG